MTVPRSCYYEWLDSPKTEREKENEALIEILKVLFEKGRGTYGTRRLKNKLAERGESLFLRKLVLGIPAQASGKNLTRPLMPSAPQTSCVRATSPLSS